MGDWEYVTLKVTGDEKKNHLPIHSLSKLHSNPSSFKFQAMAPVTPPEIFPCEIWEVIFSHLRDADCQTLRDCRGTCRYFAIWVNTRTTFWNRISLWRAVEEVTTWNSTETSLQLISLCGAQIGNHVAIIVTCLLHLWYAGTSTEWMPYQWTTVWFW